MNTVNNESFRDSLATVDHKGKRNWIYPKKPSGKFYNYRTLLSVFLLVFLFAAPFIKINGHPFLRLDVLNRSFILFTVPFGPQDFYIFGLLMIATILFIFLFTAIFGRIFCGWLCPQTVFLEMVFRRLEYLIEGDAGSQRKLNEAPWTGGKIFKKTFKHVLFYAISFVIANVFLAYIIGGDELFKIISDPPAQHITGLIIITIFSGVFYWVFAFFREQACTLVCPYGRLQGVMLDQNSLVIAYDYKRGEPRGKLKKNEDNSAKGDCIDCKLCVDVCPTGIDIRNGVQLECVNCTACIDACDAVMVKINKPKNLIKYASLNGIEKNEKFKFTPRTIGYTIVLALLVSLLVYFLTSRDDFALNVLRTPGVLYQLQPDNKISNIYDLNIKNKTFDEYPVQVKLISPKGTLVPLGDKIVLKSLANYDGRFMIILNRDSVVGVSTPIEVGIFSGDKQLKTFKSSFMSPRNLKEK